MESLPNIHPAVCWFLSSKIQLVVSSRFSEKFSPHPLENFVPFKTFRGVQKEGNLMMHDVVNIVSGVGQNILYPTAFPERFLLNVVFCYHRETQRFSKDDCVVVSFNFHSNVGTVEMDNTVLMHIISFLSWNSSLLVVCRDSSLLIHCLLR